MYLSLLARAHYGWMSCSPPHQSVQGRFGPCSLARVFFKLVEVVGAMARHDSPAAVGERLIEWKLIIRRMQSDDLVVITNGWRTRGIHELGSELEQLERR